MHIEVRRILDFQVWRAEWL